MSERLVANPKAQKVVTTLEHLDAVWAWVVRQVADRARDPLLNVLGQSFQVAERGRLEVDRVRQAATSVPVRPSLARMECGQAP